jgi:hypothetical protein
LGFKGLTVAGTPNFSTLPVKLANGSYK